MILQGVDLTDMPARQMSGVLLAVYVDSAERLELMRDVLDPPPPVQPQFAEKAEEPKSVEDLRSTWGITPEAEAAQKAWKDPNG